MLLNRLTSRMLIWEGNRVKGIHFLAVVARVIQAEGFMGKDVQNFEVLGE